MVIKNSLNKRVQTSDKVMKDKVDEILKNDSDLEYAYIRHNGETIMLNLKFKKVIQDKNKYSKVGKYMGKVRAEYKGKNVNTTTIPNN